MGLHRTLLAGAAGLFMQVTVGAAEDTALPPVEMQPIQVSKHAWYVQGMAGTAVENEGFVSNAGFVVTGDGVVVFDALGTPALARLLLMKIREITAEPIRKVVVSHYHADHVYGLAPIGALDYLNSPPASERLAERRISLAPWVNEQTRLVAPDRYLRDAEQFTLGEVSFTVSNLGKAHSEGDLSLYVETDQVLFSGDVIFDGRIPWLGNADTGNWLKMLERIETDKPAAIVPGHGGLSSDPAALVRLTREYLSFVREQMAEAVDNWVPFDEAYEQVDWGDYEYLPAFFEANRINAYQVYLSLEQEKLKP